MSRIWIFICHLWKTLFQCCFSKIWFLIFFALYLSLMCFHFMSGTCTLQIRESRRSFAMFWQWFSTSWWPPWGVAIKSKCILSINWAQICLLTISSKTFSLRRRAVVLKLLWNFTLVAFQSAVKSASESPEGQALCSVPKKICWSYFRHTANVRNTGKL